MDRIDIRKRSNEGDSLRASPVILRFLRRPRQSENLIQGFDQFCMSSVACGEQCTSLVTPGIVLPRYAEDWGIH